MDSFRSFWGSPGRAPPPGEVGSPPTARLREASDDELSDADESRSRSVGPISIRAPPTEGGVGLTVGSPSSTIGSDRSFEDALEREANSSQVSYGSAGPLTPVGSYTAPSLGASETGFSSSQYGFLVEGAMHRLNQLADKAEGDTSLLQDCDEDEFQQRIAKIAEENGVTVDSPSISSLVETLLPVVQEISRQTTPATTPGHAAPAAPSAEGATSAAPEPNLDSPLFRLSVRNAEQEKDSANVAMAPSAAGLRVVTEDLKPVVLSASSVKEVTIPGAEVTIPPRAVVSEVEVPPEEEVAEVQPEEEVAEVQPEEEVAEVQPEEEVAELQPEEEVAELQPEEEVAEVHPEEEVAEVQPEEEDSGDYVEVENEELQADAQAGNESKAPQAQEKQEDVDEAEVKSSAEGHSFTAKETQESVPEEEDIKVAVVEAPAPAALEEESAQVQAPIARVEEEEVEKRILQEQQQQASEASAQPPRAPVSAQEEGPEEEEFHEGEEGEEGEYEEYEEDGEEYEEAAEDEDIDGAFEELAASGQLSPEILRAIQQAQQQAAAAAQASQSNQSQAPAGLGSRAAGLGSGAGLGPRAGMGGGGSGSGPAGLGSNAAGLRSGSGSGAGAGSGSGSGAAGLGSGAGLGPALPPRPAAGAARPAQPRGAEAVPAPEEEEDLSEEQKDIKAKARALRLKLLRLALRVGHTHRTGIVAQVLYRIELAEQRQLGRGMLNRTGMNFDRIATVAQEQEAKEGSDTPLDLHIKLLFLGKTGVGKSATINNIFQQPLQSANAFESETKDIRILDVNMLGVKVTIIDTPGLGLGDGAEEANEKKMDKIERICEKMKPDVVFYVDRLDNQGREFQDISVINSITKALGEEIWFNAIVVFTHAAVAPPDGSNGQPITYDTYTSQRAHGVQSSIRTAVDDERLMNPVCLVENHPNCRTNRAGDKILPNGVVWRPQLLLLAFASKILNQANEVMKLQDEARQAQQEDEKYGNMMPLLTGLMAEARELKTPKVWVSQAEKEAQAQHEALRKRIIDLEREVYQLETSLAKEKENDDVLDFENKLAPVMAQRAQKESYLISLKTTLDLEKTRLDKNPFGEAAMKRIRAEAEEERRIMAERRRKVKYASRGGGGRRSQRKLGGGMGRGNVFWDEDEGIVQDAFEPEADTNFGIWGEDQSAPYDRAGLEPGPLEWGFQEIPPLLDDRLLVELGGKIQKEPKLLHANAEIKYTYHVSPVVNFRGDVDIDWLNQEGATFTFTADTSKTDMDKPPVAGVAVFMAKKKGAAGLKLAKIFTLRKLRNKDAPSAQRELRLSTVAGIVRSFEGEVARGLNVGMSTIDVRTFEKGRHKISFNASDFRGDFGFGVAAESEGYNVAGIMLGVNATMDSSGQGKIALAFHSEKKIWPAAIMLITGLKVLLQRWAQPGPMEMGEF